ncbi:MAG TPA: hypothetical protein DEP35_19485 [Deltaproteobacteria bacterium]|jgi:hypothetical protein|nr:hypothetical protein [Deltaproteobacteria bacterium]
MNDVAHVGSLLALDDLEEEELAHHAPQLDSLTSSEAERIARIAYRISQLDAEKRRKLLPPGTVLKPWRAFSARERLEQGVTVMRVLQALMLTGWLEQPDP